MISSWRTYFSAPTAFFGFVELEPWLGMGPNLAAFRTAQLAALALPNVGFAIGTDIGDPLGPFGSVHPRNKKVIGARLAAAALTISYGKPTPYLPPTYAGASGTPSATGAPMLVTVTLDNVPTTLVAAADHCKTEAPYKVPAAACASFTITGSDGVVYNATAAVNGKQVMLTTYDPPAGTSPVASTFGMNAWPINTIVSAEGLPLQPWSASL